MAVISRHALILAACSSKWSAFGIAENQEKSRHNLMENLRNYGFIKPVIGFSFRLAEFFVGEFTPLRFDRLKNIAYCIPRQDRPPDHRRPVFLMGKTEDRQERADFLSMTA
ncbi:hypothetical protein CLV42_11063 [Chitinophaga ginsengisoli]|uniref:Uncharacterized protein n=1 Tax=Chitinophaga ginsengisoli TaxID=363837 RepID=A0A2P8FYW0_9BACT|nr:hypothetical protein CLV42_11063 [Chitinophaga ginsengisoli]